MEIKFSVESDISHVDKKGKHYLMGSAFIYFDGEKPAYQNRAYIYCPEVLKSPPPKDVQITALKYHNAKGNNGWVTFVYEAGAKKIEEAVIEPIEKANFSIPISKLTFKDGAIKFDYSDAIFEDASKKIQDLVKDFCGYLYRCRALPETQFAFKKLMDRVKKAFDGRLNGSLELDPNKGQYAYPTLNQEFQFSGDINRIKEAFKAYCTNLELKRLLRKARSRKSFYNKQQLKAQLASMRSLKELGIDEEQIGNQIEKTFNRDKYEYRCFDLLKGLATNDTNIYCSVEGFVFNVTDDFGVKWYIFETPGKSAATYIFKNIKPIDGMLADLMLSEKKKIIADKDVQHKMGFVVRLIHRNFDQWVSHLDAIIKNKVILTAIDIRRAADVAEKIKERDNIRRGK